MFDIPASADDNVLRPTYLQQGHLRETGYGLQGRGMTSICTVKRSVTLAGKPGTSRGLPPMASGC